MYNLANEEPVKMFENYLEFFLIQLLLVYLMSPVQFSGVNIQHSTIYNYTQEIMICLQNTIKLIPIFCNWNIDGYYK